MRRPAKVTRCKAAMVGSEVSVQIIYLQIFYLQKIELLTHILKFPFKLGATVNNNQDNKNYSEVMAYITKINQLATQQTA